VKFFAVFRRKSDLLKVLLKIKKHKISPNSPFESHAVSCSGRGDEAGSGLCNCFANAYDDDDDDDDDSNNNILRFLGNYLHICNLAVVNLALFMSQATRTFCLSLRSL